MKIRCPRCSTLYSLPDDRACPGVKLRCRHCGERVEVCRAPRVSEAPGPTAAPTAADASAPFSLSALTELARATAPVPESEPINGTADDDSSLIDLRKLREQTAAAPDEARGPGSHLIQAGLPLAPLGLAPLGEARSEPASPLAVAHRQAESVERTNRAGLVIGVGSVLVAVGVAVVLVYLRTAGVQPRAAGTVVPAAEAASAQSARLGPSAPAAAPSVSASSTGPAESAPVASSVAEPERRRPVGRAGPSARRLPAVSARNRATEPAPEPPRPARRDSCAHCGPTDLACHIACKAK